MTLKELGGMLPVIVLGLVFSALFLIAFVMPDCANEDATMCIWNAKEQGNGIGQSFITLWDGFTIYVGE
jgi:hypothetical protein